MVLPVHDINPVRRTPWVTYGLVAANVIVLLLTPGSRSTVTGATTTAQLCSQQAFFDRYAAIPHELTTDHPVTQVATGQPGPNPDTCYISKPAYHKSPVLSVLFSMFIHEGWLHLLGNMLFLVDDSDIGVEVPLEDGLVWAALHQDAIVIQLPDRTGPLAGEPAAALLRRGSAR